MARDLPYRQTARLKGFDYSQSGYYYITICTQDRECLFGNIENGIVAHSPQGNMVIFEWLKLRARFSCIRLHSFVVMPNHLHGIIQIMRATTRVAPTIGRIIGGLKSITTHEYIDGIAKYHWQSFNQKLWQRNYFEHVVRDEADFNRIKQYIIQNPSNWSKDEFRP